MKRPCEAGKWWVSLNGREVFRGHGRGSALSYASSLALVSARWYPSRFMALRVLFGGTSKNPIMKD